MGIGCYAGGCLFVLQGRPTGEALAWYVIAYGLGRFCIEFVQGDLTLPYILGFSEGQWISVFLIGVLWRAELNGIFAYHLCID
jgi:prolipoprotein diacylglyceryltransferase